MNDESDDDAGEGGPTDPTESRESSSDPRVEQGLDHLQRAAKELISASRAFLDVIEEVVDHPDAMREALGSLSSLGDIAGIAARQVHRRRSEWEWSDGDDSGDDDGDPPVQRIPVS